MLHLRKRSLAKHEKPLLQSQELAEGRQMAFQVWPAELVSQRYAIHWMVVQLLFKLLLLHVLGQLFELRLISSSRLQQIQLVKAPILSFKPTNASILIVAHPLETPHHSLARSLPPVLNASLPTLRPPRAMTKCRSVRAPLIRAKALAFGAQLDPSW